MKNRFQNLSFKCNLQRYNTGAVVWAPNGGAVQVGENPLDPALESAARFQPLHLVECDILASSLWDFTNATCYSYLIGQSSKYSDMIGQSTATRRPHRRVPVQQRRRHRRRGDGDPVAPVRPHRERAPAVLQQGRPHPRLGGAVNRSLLFCYKDFLPPDAAWKQNELVL
jgi:hypothetical protein